MIKTLDIVNFQAHKESHFDFVPGINAITGASDQGKTAVIRALKWLITNRPTGEDFKNWDAGKKDSVAVEITTDDNLTISLERSKGSNTYRISDEVETIEYSTLKKQIPEEVIQALDIPEDSIQMQHDPFFFLRESPGELARKINNLVGLSIIDTFFENINRKLRSANEDIKNLRSQRNEIESDLEKYKNIDRIEILITLLEEKNAEAMVTASALTSLKKHKQTLTEIKIQREKHSPLLSAEDKMNYLLDCITALLDVRKSKGVLTSLSCSLCELKEDREGLQAWFEPEEPMKIILQKIEDLDQIQDSTKLLIAWKKSFTDIQTKKENLMRKKDSTVQEYVKILTEEQICPTCFSSINSKIVKKITEDLEK
jgi:exonuclease SbcC